MFSVSIVIKWGTFLLSFFLYVTPVKSWNTLGIMKFQPTVSQWFSTPFIQWDSFQKENYKKLQFFFSLQLWLCRQYTLGKRLWSIFFILHRYKMSNFSVNFSVHCTSKKLEFLESWNPSQTISPNSNLISQFSYMDDFIQLLFNEILSRMIR